MVRTIVGYGIALALAASVLNAQTASPTPQTKPASKPSSATAKVPKFFPYQVHERKLPNGLTVIVIPTPEFKDMVTYATPVFAGSRNETERGKTGLAHLFEHMMFLHEYGGKDHGYDEMIRLMGAHNNAWTNYDMTFYHPTTFTQNLLGPVKRPGATVPGLIELEASRFTALKVGQKTFEVQAGAVLGEYRRIFSYPSEKMIEQLSPLVFPNHPYGHTVIGFRDDVENMPKAWNAAWAFYNNYYQPNSLAIVVVGDVKPDTIFAEVEKRYANWKPVETPTIPEPAEPDGEKVTHVDWEAEVSPRVMVGYRTPAAQPGTKDTAVTTILEELLISRSAPLFQKLRYKKQTVTDMGFAIDPMTTDPFLLLIDTELKLDEFQKNGQKYIADVRTDLITGIEELQNFSKQPNAAQTLRVIKSKVRNDFLGSLDSTGDIAQIFSVLYRFDRRTDTIDRMMAAIDSLTPADVDAFAKKYFTPNRRVVATLWKGDTQQTGTQKEGQ